jgi:hypothetical protein
MLNQATHWIEFLATAADVLLLCRVLQLRLQRFYLFITLACVLSVLFDAVSLALHNDSRGSFQVFLYSRFLYAVVYPLVAWDVFEEIGSQIARLRRFALTRLISGLLFVTMFGFIMGAFFQSSDDSASPLVITMALVLWAGAATAAFAFLITIHRVLRSQPLGLPNNTRVWLLYFEISFAVEALYCFTTVLLQGVRVNWVPDAVSIVFMLFGTGLTAWCIWNLRALPKSLSSARETAQ